MDVTYVVLAYGNQNLLIKCLQTFRLFHPSDPLIVADNGGPDGELTKRLTENFKGTYILNPLNDSLSKLMNMGVAEAKTPYVCIVTHGVEFTTRLTEQFEKDFEKDPLVSCVGGLLMYPDGRIQHGGGRRFWNYGAMGHYGQNKFPHQAKLCLIPAYRMYVTGATAAIRKSSWEKHPYDEKLTMSCEDTDFCFKSWQAGERVFYDPLITSIHKEGASRGRTAEEKMTKAPQLVEREHKSLQLFNSRYSDLDCQMIDSEVNKLNRELHPELPLGFVRNGATGDVLRTLQAFDALNRLNIPKMVVITQVPEIFRDRECVAVSTQEEEYAVSGFINLDLAYERRRDLSIEQAYGGVVLGVEDLKNNPLNLKTTHLDWHNAKGIAPEFEWDKPYVVMHFGTGWPGKVMPIGFWQELAGKIRQKGFKIVCIGAGGDYQAGGDGILSIVGKTNLHELRAIMERAKLFIGNDSGPLHVSDGACPSIGLFTITRPEKVVSDQVTGIMTKAECAGCQLRRPLATNYQCDYSDQDPRQFLCSRMFSPDEVLEKAMELIKGAK